MVTEYIRYKIQNEKIVQFVEDYKNAALELDKSRYCKDFDLTQCVDEKTDFILRIVWTSTADHMEKFRNSPEFLTFFSCIKPYLENILEMRHYEYTDVRAK
jgi:hemoglobin